MATSRHLKPPVLSRPELLPLKQLDWSAFEAFCCELLNLCRPALTFSNYGKRGDAQQGIDLLGKGENGTCWVAQCKQVDDFTAKHAEKAVKAMTFKADQYLLLISDEARANVRKVIHAEPNWELWDVRDISRRVRDLPQHKSKRLVEQYFGLSWCRDFLGLPGPSVLLTPEEYFTRQLDSTRLFHHAWERVGREELLNRLDSLLGPTHDAALLWGRGGIGKTKLLYEWSRLAAERHPEVPLFFIDPQRPLETEALQELPPSSCVLIFDDAHPGGPLDSLLAMLRKHSGARLLLCCRPESRHALRSWLSRADFDGWKTLELEVPPLSSAECLALAQQGLGEQRRHLAAKLAAISADSPLATVLGARLVSKHGADPRLISNHEEFKHLFVECFEEIIHGTVSPGVDPGLCSRLLQLLSALAPFDVEDAFVPVKVRDFLGIDEASLHNALVTLTEAGALLRTGTRLRITPDLLAEHILEEACVKEGASTGYAEKVFELFQGIWAEPLMRNLSALGWRLRQCGKEPPGFLDGIWAKLRNVLQTGNNRDRQFVLRIVISAADLDPQRALDCGEAVLHRLHVEGADRSRNDVSEVLRLAFSTLWSIQESSESLVQHCLDRLWEEGQDDPRPLTGNAQLDHGLGMLCWMARCRPKTPAGRYMRMLEAIERWLNAPDALDHVHSPLPVLGALLGKSANIYSESEEGFEFRTFIVDAEQMRPVRRRALDLIQRCARSGRCQVVRDASWYLAQALRNPKPFAETEPVELHLWIPEQFEIIQRMQQLAEELREPFFRYLLIQALHPATHERMDPQVFERALAFISSVPADFEIRLVHSLCSDLLGDPPMGRRPPEELSALWPARVDILPSVARELRDRFPDPSAGARFLHGRSEFLNQLRQPKSDATALLRALAEQVPSYAQEFCESAIEQRSPYLYHALPGALRVLWKQEPTWFRALARKLMASGQRSQRELVARTYASAGMAHQHKAGEVLSLDDEELGLLALLLKDEDPEIRNYSVFWLEVLEPSRDAWLHNVLARFDINGNPSLPGNLCAGLRALHARGGLSGERLDPFLHKLFPLRRYSEFVIRKFLFTAAQHAPQQILEFILSRIERVGRDAPEDFEPFSLEREPDLFSPLGEGPLGASILREVIARLSRAPDDQRRWLAMLFNALSFDCTSRAGIALLEEQAGTSNEASLEAVSWVLSHASADWVFDWPDLTRQIMERAHEVGAACQRDVEQRLLERAVLGRKAGVWQSTVPKGEKRLELARERKSRLPLRSAALPFYAQLVEQLEAMNKSLLASPDLRRELGTRH